MEWPALPGKARPAFLESRPGPLQIRKFIWEYAITLERILFRIEEDGLTISGKKFACCVPALESVGHALQKLLCQPSEMYTQITWLHQPRHS